MVASFSFNYQFVLLSWFPEKLDITMAFIQLSLLNAKEDVLLCAFVNNLSFQLQATCSSVACKGTARTCYTLQYIVRSLLRFTSMISVQHTEAASKRCS